MKGLLFLLPTIATIIVAKLVLDWVNGWFAPFSKSLAERFLPVGPLVEPLVPWLSLALLVLCLAAVGAMASWSFGTRVLMLFDRVCMRLPLLRTVYKAVRKIVDALGPGTRKYQKVVLVDKFGSGVLDAAFVVGETIDLESGQKYYRVIFPSKPYPTGGDVVFVPEHRCMQTDMTPAQVLEYCMSMGTQAPDTLRISRGARPGS